MNEIRLKIHQESDLYNPLDPEQVMLDDTVIAYLLRKCEEMKTAEHCCINIISDIPVDEERVRTNIRENIKRERRVQENEHTFCSIKQVRLFLIGVFFLGMWLLAAAKTENIGVEVLSIIGSFAVWEAADIWISEKPGIRLKKMILLLLEKTELKFTAAEKE